MLKVSWFNFTDFNESDSIMLIENNGQQTLFIKKNKEDDYGKYFTQHLYIDESATREKEGIIFLRILEMFY